MQHCFPHLLHGGFKAQEGKFQNMLTCIPLALSDTPLYGPRKIHESKEKKNALNSSSLGIL
jgi:hypothetical protein